MSRRLMMAGIIVALVAMACSSTDSSSGEIGEEPIGDSIDAGGAPYEQREVSSITTALIEGGLTMCDTESLSGDFSGSYKSQNWEVVVAPRECPGDSLEDDFLNYDLVVADAYSDQSTRDDAALQMQQGFGDSLFGYYYGEWIVAVTDASAPETLDAFAKAMESTDATIAFDHRTSSGPSSGSGPVEGICDTGGCCEANPDWEGCEPPTD